MVEVQGRLTDGLVVSNYAAQIDGISVFESSHPVLTEKSIRAAEILMEKLAALSPDDLFIYLLSGGSSALIEKTAPTKAILAIGEEIATTGHPFAPPVCLLFGGETTVTLRGRGKGGRNQEFVLAAAMEIAGWEEILVLSAGSDGTDGPTDAAGAFADGKTLQRGKTMGLDPRAFLKENDSYSFFQKMGDLLITGPTGTNVMDLRILLIKQPDE